MIIVRPVSVWQFYEHNVYMYMQFLSICNGYSFAYKLDGHYLAFL